MRRLGEEQADAAQHALWVVEDLVVGKTQDGQPAGTQEGIALAIRRRRREVRGAVGFDDKARWFAEEVDDEWAQRLLTSKLSAAQAAVAQHPPENAFSTSRCTPKGSSPIGGRSQEARHTQLIDAVLSPVAQPRGPEQTPLSLRERGWG